MNLGKKKEGIVVVGEIQRREDHAADVGIDQGSRGKLSKERDLSLSVILSECGIKEEGKEALQLRELMKSSVSKMKN